jgi:hypothetical protein
LLQADLPSLHHLSPHWYPPFAISNSDYTALSPSVNYFLP